MSNQARIDRQLRSGYVAIVGRANVGKSTLLNRLLGQKISITSRKPQTTRHQILGVKTLDETQIIYVDTPGIQADGQDKALARYMNRAVESVLHEVDLVVMVVDRTAWTATDELVLQKLRPLKCPLMLVVNKVDLLEDKAALLPALAELAQRHAFVEIVPLSARSGDQVDKLEALIAAMMPPGVHYYPPDQITDRSERFLAAEIVREKIMRRVGDEVPYQVTVAIESFKTEGAVFHIDALILVERAGQKKILIGHKGEQLKAIGREARLDMERLFDSKVMLRLWIKVKSGWSDDERALRSLGYEEG